MWYLIFIPLYNDIQIFFSSYSFYDSEVYLRHPSVWRDIEKGVRWDGL